MSNKTQLSTNNTKLASLIQELANKAAGGGGVETCTVTINYIDGAPDQAFYVYTAAENGEIVSKYLQYGSNSESRKVTPVTLENVVKGTILTTDGYGAYQTPYINSISGCERLNTNMSISMLSYTFRITDNATINIINSY